MMCGPTPDGGNLASTVVTITRATWKFPKLGVPFWGPHNKDRCILVCIYGNPEPESPSPTPSGMKRKNRNVGFQ